MLLPQETLVQTIPLKPRRVGKREILVNLSTDLVPGITGSVEVMVLEIGTETVGFRPSTHSI